MDPTDRPAAGYGGGVSESSKRAWRIAAPADSAYPDLVGIVGGPMIPCKVTEIVATSVPTDRVEGTDGMNAHYEQAQRYVIRYQTAPVAISYMAGVSDEEIARAKQAVVETALDIWDETQEAPGRVPTVIVGQDFSPEHRYVLRAYRRAHRLPVVGTAPTPTAVEVNQAVTWWNRQLEVDG